MVRTLFLLLGAITLLLVGCDNGGQDSSDGNEKSPTARPADEGYPDSSNAEISEGGAGPSGDQTESGYPGSGQADNTSDGAYPGPNSVNPADDSAGYPGPSGSGYPAPGTQVDESKRFLIEEPLVDGQLEVSGTGVPDISIKVISVSNAGEALGFGVVTNDGEFTIKLNRATTGGEILGLQFANDSTAKALSDVPGTDFPFIGLVLAQAVVER